MKTQIGIAFFAVMALAAFIAGPANASTRTGTEQSAVFSSELKAIDVDPALNLGEISGGSVLINQAEKTATLILNRGWSCPAGHMCPMIMPAPYIMTLPITEVTVGNCNVTRIVAVRGVHAVDGSSQELEILDHTNDNCRYFAAVPATEVTYETDSARPALHTRSTFSGTLLEQVEPVKPVVYAPAVQPLSP